MKIIRKNENIKFSRKEMFEFIDLEDTSMIDIEVSNKEKIIVSKKDFYELQDEVSNFLIHCDYGTLKSDYEEEKLMLLNKVKCLLNNITKTNQEDLLEETFRFNRYFVRQSIDRENELKNKLKKLG